MSQTRYHALAMTAAALLVTVSGLSGAARGAAVEVSDAEFARLSEELRLKNQPWAQVPWKVNVTEARRLAHAQRKPVFLVVNTGNCLGFV